MLTSAHVKRAALEAGADAVGIGSLDRFDGAPPEMDPRLIAPGAKSIIGLIFRIPRGYVRGIEEGTHFYQYPSMGYAGINEVFAPTVLYNLGRFIEDNGHEACVYRNTGGRSAVSDMTGKPGREESPELHGKSSRRSLPSVPAAPGLPAPDVLIHFRIAAYLCGLGEIGYSKMLLTPQFGPANRQAFLLTDAELEPDPLYEGPELCNRCMACVRACPGRCLDADEQVRVTVAGRELSWGRLDEWKCFAYYLGAARKSNPFLPPDALPGVPDRERILRAEKETISPEAFPAIAKGVHRHYACEISGYNPPKCGGCLRACLHAMERRGVLTRRFEQPFRDKQAWKLED